MTLLVESVLRFAPEPAKDATVMDREGHVLKLGDNGWARGPIPPHFQETPPMCDEGVRMEWADASLNGGGGTADLLKGPAERGANLPVREAMRGELETASPSEALDGALTRMHRAKSRVSTVVKNEKVVGFLTLGNIGELLALQAAGRRPGASASGTGDGTGR